MIASRPNRWVIAGVAMFSAAVGVAWWFSREPAVAPREPVVDKHRGEFVVEEYCPPSRASTDPRNAYVVGTITRDGHPLGGVQVETIVACSAAAANVDTTTSNPDGTFAVAITAGALVSRRIIEVTVVGRGLWGRKALTVAPGEIVRDVKIEVTGL